MLCPGARWAVRADTNLPPASGVACQAWFCLVPGVGDQSPALFWGTLLFVVPGVLALLGIFLPEWDRTYITCVPGPRQPPLPRTAQGAPGELPLLAVGPQKPAASLTIPCGPGDSTHRLRCLLGAVLARRPAHLRAWWSDVVWCLDEDMGTPHLYPTDQIVAGGV